jgi:uncharacterized RDD family membrane protein YckC
VPPMTTPPATDPGVTPDGAQLASWGRRLSAYLIDGLIISTVSFSLSWHWLSNYIDDAIDRIDETSRTGGTTPSPFAGMFDSWGNMLVIGLVGIAVFVIYHATLLRFANGASLGKKALGVRVRLRERDGRLPWSAIGQRLLIQLVPSFGALVPLFGSVVVIFGWVDGLWPLWDAKNQALHEKWPDTNVVHR